MAPRVITHRLQRWLAIDRTLRQHGYTDIVVDGVDYSAGVAFPCALSLAERALWTLLGQRNPYADISWSR